MARRRDEGVEREQRRGLPRWKIACLALAVLAVLVGLGLRAAADEPATRAPGAGPGSSLVAPGAPGPAGGTGESQPAAEEGLGAWSPLFVRGGFSFLVGFAVGFALRAMLKVTLVVLGLVFLALAGLSYAGIVPIDWTALGEGFESLRASLSDEARGFQSFLTSSLPSAAAAGVGLIAGFKR